MFDSYFIIKNLWRKSMKINENQRRIYGKQRNVAFDSSFIIKNRWRKSTRKTKIKENQRIIAFYLYFITKNRWHKFIKSMTETYGNQRKSTKHLWKSKQFCVLLVFYIQRKSKKIYENQRKSMKIYSNLWKSKKINLNHWK